MGQSVSGAEFEPETFRIRRHADHSTETFGHTSVNVSRRPKAFAKKKSETVIVDIAREPGARVHRVSERITSLF